MKSPELFYKSVYEDYNSNRNKNIILMAGPSSSGKGFESKKLAEYFSNNGENIIRIEADNYYKGMSKIIVEKALMNKEFSKYQEFSDEIVRLVRSVIEYSDFSDKFCYENRVKLLKTLAGIFHDDTLAFVGELEYQKQHINFDEPFAINFQGLANDINKLSNGEDIRELSYSFDTSETTYTDKVIKAEGNDVILVEGLYALRDELLDSIDFDKTIRCGIDCDIKSLMSRRFDRDIRGGRSTFTPGQTMEIFICTVMPSYFRYIKPTMVSADHILDARITPHELAKRMKSNQIKFRVTDDIEKLLEKATLLGEEEQVDYFFEDGYDNNNVTLRIRSGEGLVNQICLKAGQKLSDRIVDEYDVSSALEPSKRDLEEFIYNLMNAGFTPIDILRKSRRTYNLNGIEFNVDDVDGMGKYVELELGKLEIPEEEKQARVEYIKAKLGLDNEPEIKSYKRMKNENLVKADKQEVERKYKLDMTDDDFNNYVRNKDCKHIIQYYLDMSRDDIQDFLVTCFGGEIKFSNFAEARIRIIDNKKAFVTLKSRGLENRRELEKEIPVQFAEMFTDYAVSYVEKNRYTATDQYRELTVEVDDYLDRDDLRVIEVEYDPEKENEESVREFVESGLMGTQYYLTDVTKDRNYKNKNLAIDLTE